MPNQEPGERVLKEERLARTLANSNKVGQESVIGGVGDAETSFDGGELGEHSMGRVPSPFERDLAKALPLFRGGGVKAALTKRKEAALNWRASKQQLLYHQDQKSTLKKRTKRRPMISRRRLSPQ
jgi:hypothetical protein